MARLESSPISRARQGPGGSRRRPDAPGRFTPRPSVEDAASDALDQLYTALAGEPPRALRAYRDDDALLLLLRFNRDLVGIEHVPLMAMPELVAQIVARRTSATLVPGDLSVSDGNGLAVFGFSVIEDAGGDDRSRGAGLHLDG